MRKSCKRKHYDTTTNPLNYVLNGMLPASIAPEIARVSKKNFLALQAVTNGSAKHADINTLMAAYNIAKALCMLGIGEEFILDIEVAHAATRRLQASESLTQKELESLQFGLDIHEAQLSDSRTTVSMMEGALRVVNREIRVKKQQKIKEKA